MKNVIATVTVLGLLALAPAASAQPDQHKQDEHKQGGGPPQGARPGGQPGPQGHAPERAPGGPGGGHNGPAERAPERGPAPNGGGHNAPAPDRSAGQGAFRQGPNDHARGEPAAGRAPERNSDRSSEQRAVNGPNPGGRNVQQAGRTSNAGPAHRGADVAALRGNVQASRRFQAGAYRPPQGYQPRRWGYGDRLPHAYYARNYWLTNFLIYGLLAPPPGLVWVRVGPDALLIDQYSGEIIRVDYGVFY